MKNIMVSKNMVFAHCYLSGCYVCMFRWRTRNRRYIEWGKLRMSSKVQTNNKILAIMRMTLVRQPAKKKKIGGNHANSHAGMER